MTMLTKRRHNPQEVISIEEYLNKRQQIRGTGRKEEYTAEFDRKKLCADAGRALYIRPEALIVLSDQDLHPFWKGGGRALQRIKIPGV